MTYPPEDYYEKDLKKTKGLLRTVFSKHFLIAATATVILYYIIDKILLYITTLK